jgi:hypothetical protein
VIRISCFSYLKETRRTLTWNQPGALGLFRPQYSWLKQNVSVSPVLVRSKVKVDMSKTWSTVLVFVGKSGECLCLNCRTVNQKLSCKSRYWIEKNPRFKFKSESGSVKKFNARNLKKKNSNDSSTLRAFCGEWFVWRFMGNIISLKTLIPEGSVGAGWYSCCEAPCVRLHLTKYRLFTNFLWELK